MVAEDSWEYDMLSTWRPSVVVHMSWWWSMNGTRVTNRVNLYMRRGRCMTNASQMSRWWCKIRPKMIHWLWRWRTRTCRLQICTCMCWWRPNNRALVKLCTNTVSQNNPYLSKTITYSIISTDYHMAKSKCFMNFRPVFHITSLINSCTIHATGESHLMDYQT